MEKKTYIINLSGEDGAATSVELSPEVYETLKEAFEELNDACRYVSISIEEPIKTERVYYVKLNRFGRPVDGPKAIVYGCDIPEQKNVYDVLTSYPDKVKIFDTCEDARAFINSFKKKKN